MSENAWSSCIVVTLSIQHATVCIFYMHLQILQAFYSLRASIELHCSWFFSFVILLYEYVYTGAIIVYVLKKLKRPSSNYDKSTSCFWLCLHCNTYLYQPLYDIISMRIKASEWGKTASSLGFYSGWMNKVLYQSCFNHSSSGTDIHIQRVYLVYIKCSVHLYCQWGIKTTVW